ncbi:MAG: hypothetical protein Q9219_006157 [cf. Caloplaca sp. 3 TL-2023]
MPSSKEKASSVSGSGDKWGEVLRIHAEHGLIFEQGSDALTLPPTIEQAVGAVMNTNSWNDMKTSSACKIIDKMASSGSSNELSFLIEFWTGLHKETSFGSTGAEPIEKEWEDVGLVMRFDQQFCLRGPSMLDISNPEDKKILAAVPEIQHTQPDITIGLREKLGSREFFDEKERSANMILNRTTQVTYDVFHPFAVWEQKKSKPIELAQVQCLRGGSTLVWAFRHNQAEAGMLDLDKPGIDATNIAFSFAANTTIIRIFVHYAVVGEDKKTKYYMQEIREFSLNEKDQLKRLRSDLDHILDWGTLTRINGPGGVKEMLKRIKPLSEARKAQKTHPAAIAGASSRAC